jgi:hypothetical protein
MENALSTSSEPSMEVLQLGVQRFVKSPWKLHFQCQKKQNFDDQVKIDPDFS